MDVVQKSNCLTIGDNTRGSLDMRLGITSCHPIQAGSWAGERAADHHGLLPCKWQTPCIILLDSARISLTEPAVK